MIIGITGTSGAGKTLASNIIGKKLNYKVINADEIVKKSSIKGQIYYEEIIKIFGREIIDSNEEIDKSKLVSIIFNNKEQREKLNKLTYIYIVGSIKKQIEKNCIIDAPLLFESKLNTLCDITLAIIADEKIKIERICERDKIDKETAQKRLKAQETDAFYKKNAKYIIVNNSMAELEKQIEEIFRR